MSYCVKKIKAFSLVELMVVISIISIIVGLTIPKFEAMQIRAKDTEATLNLKSIHSLYSGWRVENEKHFLLADLTTWNTDNPGTQPSIPNNHYLSVHSPNNLGFYCEDSKNFLGFKIDCNRANFFYFYRVFDSNGFQFFAANNIGKPLRSFDFSTHTYRSCPGKGFSICNSRNYITGTNSSCISQCAGWGN